MSSIMNPWISLLKSLSLSKTEQEVVKRFQQDPTGRSFLPVADILRAHKLYDESLEILSQGVSLHPQFTVARVVFARELLQKGMVGEAWRALEESPVSLRDNLLAQKLRFRLAILLAMEPVIRATLGHLKLHQMLDAETKRLADMFEISGLDHAREKLIQDLRDRGTEPVLPDAVGADQIDPTFTLATPSKKADAAGDSPFEEKSFSADSRLSGFHVVPLNEIFHPEAGAAPRVAGAGGVELDTTTLADIYCRQGHFTKALAVYRRLLKITPHNDFLRRKVAELARLEREQKSADLSVDPTLVDRMETVEILDRQIKFYNDLLSRLM